MNAVSKEFVWCAYPDLTLERHSILGASITHDLNLPISTYENDSVDKIFYINKGFLLCEHISCVVPTHICGQHPACPHTIRTTLMGPGLYYSFREHPGDESEARRLRFKDLGG